MTLFNYPSSRHTRTQNPPEFKGYGGYKPYLQVEFARRCVYCRQPDTLTPNPQFGADHYRPKSRFPHLANEYTNLYYCCSSCNRSKSDWWPTPQQEGRVFIPNPCEHEMSLHFRTEGGLVHGKTPAGEHTANLLRLNAPTRVEFRRRTEREVAMHLEQKRLFEAARKTVQRAARRAKGAAADQAALELAVLDEQIAAVERDLAAKQGTTPIAGLPLPSR